MRIALSLLFVSCFSFAGFEIEIFRGDVKRVEKDGAHNLISGKKNLGMREAFTMSEKAVLRFSNREGLQGYIYGPGDVVFNDTLEATTLHLGEGVLRWQSKGKQKLVILTPMSETAVSDGDFSLSYNPNTPRVDWWVFKGALHVQGLGQDDFHAIKEGERSSFIGENENGKPIFDVLLRGAKVVRGKLTGVEKFAAADRVTFEKNHPWMAKVEAPKKKVDSRTADQICEKPFAKMNECVWRTTSKGCIRERCLANGQWGDSIEVKPDPRCSATPRPGVCGY